MKLWCSLISYLFSVYPDRKPRPLSDFIDRRPFTFIPGFRSIGIISGFLILVLPVVSASSGVVINEIYYDHPGLDGGWEFVELYNAGDVEFDLSGVSIEFLDGRTGDARIVWNARDGLILGPDSWIVIAGSNRHPPPGFHLDGSLENGPDALRLVSPGGALDLVGYGDLEFAHLYEGKPALDVDPGFSLSRRPDGRDTGTNSADLVASAPTPGTRNFFSRDLEVVVTDLDILPCRGESFNIDVGIMNSGLEPFGGFVKVESSVFANGTWTHGELLELYVELDTAGVDPLPLELRSPAADRICIRLALEAVEDQNPSNDTSRVELGTSPGPVIINEVMYRPHHGGSEWIELLNAGCSSYNLGRCRIQDASGNPRLIGEDDLLIGAGEYVVLAQFPDILAGDGDVYGFEVTGVHGGWPILNDRDSGPGAETVKIFDAEGVLIEKVTYRDMLYEERGRSIERFSETSCSAVPGGIWHRCALKEGSTPGRENSVRSEGWNDGGIITISPNPFCPAVDRYAIVSGSLLDGENEFLVRIFDMDGFEVRVLYGESGGARVFSCRWDGRDSDGSFIATGLYICVIEFVRSGGGVCRRERHCIAVAGMTNPY